MKKTKKILIVDDNQDHLEMVSEIVSSLGYHYATAKDGLIAAELIKKDRFDIAITDIKMPQLDGIQFMQLAKEHCPEIDVLVMTGYCQDYSYVEIISAGAIDFLVKPFTEQELEAKLNRLVREQQHIHYLTQEVSLRKQTEEALQNAKNELEIKVEERTTELCDSNLLLQNEVASHRQTLKELKCQKVELERKNKKIQETNTALKVLLQNRDEEKKEFFTDIQAHISKCISPYLTKLRNSGMNEKQLAYVEILSGHIHDIYSGSMSNNKILSAGLTASEIRIANFIKQHKTNKDIAMLLGVSVKTVEKHRNNIRKKLGIKNKKINLKESLLTMF